MVFQEPAILPWRTVRRNIGHGLEIMGVPRTGREKQVNRLIELTGLVGFEDRYPATSSATLLPFSNQTVSAASVLPTPI